MTEFKCLKKDEFSYGHSWNTVPCCKNSQITLNSSYLYSDRTMTLTLTMNLTVTINMWELVTVLFPRPTLISVDLFSFFPCRARLLRNTFPAGLCCHFHLKHLNISVHSLVVDLKFQMLLSLNPTEIYNVHRAAIQSLWCHLQRDTACPVCFWSY